jgi:hypothetical protein
VGIRCKGEQHPTGEWIHAEPIWQPKHGDKHKRVEDYSRTIATNAGTNRTKQIVDIPGFGTVWYDKTAIANIFGVSDLKKKHRVTFNSDKEDAFTVHMESGTLKFNCKPKGVYTYEVSDVQYAHLQV